MSIIELLYFFYVFVLILVSIFSIEAWPFSAYPMFSKKVKQGPVLSFHFVLSFKNGYDFVWNSKKSFFRKSFYYDVLRAIGHRDGQERLAKVASQYYILFLTEYPSIKNVKSIEIICKEYQGLSVLCPKKTNQLIILQVESI